MSASQRVRRCGGSVLALDILEKALREPEPFAGADRVAGDAVALPLANESLDLVFAQLALLWMPAARAVAEIARVLAPGGALSSVGVVAVVALLVAWLRGGGIAGPRLSL